MSSPASQSASSSKRQKVAHVDDQLPKLWKNLSHSVVLIASKAEKVAADPTNKAALKELNEASVVFLKNRLEWGRSISYLQAKLEGNTEQHTLQTFQVKSHPKLGRKRKLE